MMRLLVALFVLSATILVQMSVVQAQYSRRCIFLNRCINRCSNTYVRCKAPGQFVSPEPVCRKALLSCVPVCHNRYGYCS